MNIITLPIEQLSVSKLNMRHGRKAPDIDDLLPSIKERGILNPLIVVPTEQSDRFEIIAGRRRYFAAKAAETLAALPCMVLDNQSDADALEISLIENLARLEPDPMSECEAFAKLVAKDRSVEEVAVLFAKTPRHIKQRLALGKLITPIKTAYRKDDIDAATLQTLTLASKDQQREWMRRLTDKGEYAPTGLRLKQWLMGGQSIQTETALFDLNDYPGQIITNLFGEASYFDDSEAFWSLQMSAIDALRDKYLEAGWSDVEVIPAERYFETWEYESRTKAKGGHVVIDIASSGAVNTHEGYLSRRAIRQLEAEASGEVPSKPIRPEMTKKLENYVALHRHGMVRTALLEAPDLALVLMAAHLLVGSNLWSVRADPQRAACASTATSVTDSSAKAGFEIARERVCSLLDMPFDASPLVTSTAKPKAFAEMFKRLAGLSQPELMAVLTFLMAERLEVGSIGVELAGSAMGIDPAAHWTPDEAFFELLRDKPAINAMLVQTRGEAIANANKNQTRSQQVEALKTGLGQSDEPWAPAYLAFPFSIYTDKSGGELAGHAAIIEAVTADDEDANETDRKTTAEPVPDAA
jgi:ParB family chromosome partitioning protein